MISQTGPAGVGTSSTNVLWLKADKGTSSTVNGAPISFWNDCSGNNINVSQTVSVQQPSYAASVLNGFPAIEFDNNNTAGQNDYLGAPDNSSLDNTSGYSFFTVSLMKNIGTDARCIISKRTSIDIDEAFMLFYWNPAYLNVDFDGLGDRQSTSPVAYTTNTGHILNAFYDGTLPAASRSKIYEEEILRKTFTETSALVPNKPSPLNVGCTHSSNNRPFGGYISEIITYTIAVNDAQRIIINNYLSSKYDLPLTSNDKYLGDTPANGNYDREVAGIGQETTGSNVSFSASVSGGLTISSNSGLDNSDYVFAGHAMSVNGQIINDVGGMSGTNNARWQRIWYIDVTNTSSLINTNIEFDMSDGGVGAFSLGSVSDYVLLYRAAQSGNWTELATANSITGDRIIFSNYNLNNDGYYTIGTKNFAVSTLPIELNDFNAVINGSHVDLSWNTNSNNTTIESFTIQKTKDGVNFETVQVIKTNNNSLEEDYKEVDLSPYTGLSYYRLIAKDKSANTIKTPLIPITNDIMQDSGIRAFPNPSDGNISVNVTGLKDQEVHLMITDVAGNKIYSRSIQTETDNEVIDIDSQKQFLSGIYMLTVSSGDKAYNQKLIIK
ncbi:MAG: hypothetical protein K0S32_2122 [Bacteroidetes bacterium]|nr:hypothetical protein [Bacteroidota bacterium]